MTIRAEVHNPAIEFSAQDRRDRTTVNEPCDDIARTMNVLKPHWAPRRHVMLLRRCDRQKSIGGSRALLSMLEARHIYSERFS
jgi:hypothetical protein